MILIALLLPSIIFLGIVFGFPLLSYLWLSLHANSVLTSFRSIFNGWANWNRFIHDYRYWQDFLQTIRFSVASVGIELLLGLIIALILHRPMKFRGWIRSSSLIPWALPTTVMALGWRWIFNSLFGPIDRFATAVCARSLMILGNASTAWIATVYSDVWKTTPFVALILLAGLQSIPADLYEACRLEGASASSCFRRITLPLLMPYIGLAAMFRLAQAFGVFDLIQVMTGGGPASSTESIALYAYLNALRFLDFGYGATIIIGSFILLSILVASCWFFVHLFNRKRSIMITK